MGLSGQSWALLGIVVIGGRVLPSYSRPPYNNEDCMFLRVIEKTETVVTGYSVVDGNDLVKRTFNTQEEADAWAAGYQECHDEMMDEPDFNAQPEAEPVVLVDTEDEPAVIDALDDEVFEDHQPL